MAEYPNRSDLRNPMTRKVAFTGQTYGEGAAQERSQGMVSPGSAPSETEAQAMAAEMSRRIRPGSMPLTRPTERPDEPITAGVPFGPGPGPIAAGVQPRMVAVDSTLETLQALYELYPNEGLAALLNEYSTGDFSGRV